MDDQLSIRQINELKENDIVNISMYGKIETYAYKGSYGDCFSRQFYFQNELGDSLSIENSDFDDIELKLKIQRA